MFPQDLLSSLGMGAESEKRLEMACSRPAGEPEDWTGGMEGEVKSCT